MDGDESLQEAARLWRASVAALTERLQNRAFTGRNSTLTPPTALMAARGLALWIAAPTREEVAAVFCQKLKTCQPLCNRCTGLANKVMQIYGETADQLLERTVPRETVRSRHGDKGA